MEIETIAGLNLNELIEEIHNIVEKSRNKIAANVNIELLLAYWNIGKIIVEKEKKSQIDNQTSRKIILQISNSNREVGQRFLKS